MNTKKLKQLVLDLAIHGKLVPQDPNDEPASELLKRIQAEKAKSAKGKKCKIVEEDTIPFEIPIGWMWCTMDEIAFVTKLAGFEYTKYIVDNLSNISGVPLFKGKNVQDGHIVYEFESYIPENISDELCRSQITRKCLLTPYVGTIGNIGIHDRNGKYHLGSNVGKIEVYNGETTFIKEEYLWYFLRSSSGYSELTKNKKATAQESISIDAIREVYIPLPPLSEQKRIVSAIEKWFAVIDQLESNEADLRKSIEQTKKKVLDLAIHGKLVEQDENDEPASELLKRIKENHYICKKDDELFDIPSSWIWAKISDVGDLSRGKGFLKSDFVEDGYPCIHYGQIHMKFGLSTKKELTYIPESVAMKSGIAHPNDVIIAITSEDELCSCKSTAWLGDYDVAVGSHAAIYHHKINPMYVSFFLASKCFYDQKILYTHGSKVIEIRPADIGNCYIPLPPLSEQKRIVAKIEEVMGELDKMMEMMG